MPTTDQYAAQGELYVRRDFKQQPCAHGVGRRSKEHEIAGSVIASARSGGWVKL